MFQWTKVVHYATHAEWAEINGGYYANFSYSLPVQYQQVFSCSCITYDNIYTGYLAPSINNGNNNEFKPLMLFDTNYFNHNSNIFFYVTIINS